MTASIPTVIETNPTKTLHIWKPATWEEYLTYRDDPTTERVRLFFHQGYLLVIDMGGEGINHATISDLFTMLFFIWFNQKPEQIFSSLGRCLIEKPNTKAGAPDLVLYLGEDYPRWKTGESRRIDLNQWRVPNLVGEIADTTLATDLDEKKQLYADFGIPEYWVVDVRGQRVIAFQLQQNCKYKECTQSLTLEGLPISLLEQTLALLNEGTNGSAATWFAQQIANLE
ncbi:Uma2 family endonuclease [Microcoleus sp. FACHB-SPT15]|uniref:Uma2 family endonuclease n=1 Tax=Microcoleus sp. FACHB-SPT15 TaxID=2692830 RepID=UPI001780284C|nr:Uma2 family endonuclease [Microcoleus sp. FACHB-SPT15]MBD1806395.1 Uma2 family endonuclease [Microcoleus sp. FACHB-SPT15]